MDNTDFDPVNGKSSPTVSGEPVAAFAGALALDPVAEPPPADEAVFPAGAALEDAPDDVPDDVLPPALLAALEAAPVPDDVGEFAAEDDDPPPAEPAPELLHAATAMAPTASIPITSARLLRRAPGHVVMSLSFVVATAVAT